MCVCVCVGGGANISSRITPFDSVLTFNYVQLYSVLTCSKGGGVGRYFVRANGNYVLIGERLLYYNFYIFFFFGGVGH